MQIRNFWVDVENASGVRVGKGPLRAYSWSNDELLSASGAFSFDVSILDPNIGALTEKRVVVCKYIDRAGTLQVFGGGIVDKITTATAEDGSMSLHVEGNDLTRELMGRSVGALDLSGVGGAGVANGPTLIMALAPAGWSIANGTTLKNVYVGYDGESVLSALIRCGEHIGEHWRLGSGRVIEWLRTSSTFAASGVRAVQHVNDVVGIEAVDTIALITSFEEVSDASDLVTRVIPRGSGTGGVTLTLVNATNTPPAGYTLDKPSNYVRRDAAEISYGRIERALDFKEIGPLSNSTADLQAAANMLLQASIEHLRRYGTPQKFYKIGLANASKLLRPGTTMHVVFRKVENGVVLYDLNGVFNVLAVKNVITPEGAHTSEVTVSTIDRMPQSDSEYLARQVMQAKVLSAHQQLGPSVDTMTFRDEMDDTHGATFRFWLGDEYTSIQSAVLRFRIQPLRSTVKSVAGQSTTTSSGGGSTSGSGGGGSVTSEGTPHGHAVTVYSFGPEGNPVYFDGEFLNHGGGVGTFTTQAELPAGGHTHSVSVPAHSHSTPDHTHQLTPNITTQYGIFEESGANTLALTDLVIKLNSGGNLLSSVVDIGNGWYELDFSGDLVDTAFRPSQKNNSIAITTSADKTARLEAQITIRGVVQAVNYN